jgi:hypothetical protein
MSDVNRANREYGLLPKEKIDLKYRDLVSYTSDT